MDKEIQNIGWRGGGFLATIAMHKPIRTQENERERGGPIGTTTARIFTATKIKGFLLEGMQGKENVTTVTQDIGGTRDSGPDGPDPTVCIALWT